MCSARARASSSSLIRRREVSFSCSNQVKRLQKGRGVIGTSKAALFNVPDAPHSGRTLLHEARHSNTRMVRISRSHGLCPQDDTLKRLTRLSRPHNSATATLPCPPSPHACRYPVTPFPTHADALFPVSRTPLPPANTLFPLFHTPLACWYPLPLFPHPSHLTVPSTSFPPNPSPAGALLPLSHTPHT